MRYNEPRCVINVLVPVRLHKLWQTKCKGKISSSLSAMVTHALSFGLTGPHPYEDPLDGLIDAFETYERRKLDEKEFARHMVHLLADYYGIDDLGPVPTDED